MNPLTTHPKDGNYVLFVERIDEISEKDSLLAKSIEKNCAELEKLHKKSESLTYYNLPEKLKNKYPDLVADDIRIIVPDAKRVRPLSNSDLSMLSMLIFNVGYENPAILKLSFNQRNYGLSRLGTVMRDLLCQEIFKVPPEYFLHNREEILRCFCKDYEPKIVENGVVYPYSSWLLKQSFNTSSDELKFKITCAYRYDYKE